MSERDVLKVSPVKGANVLLMNGFSIYMGGTDSGTGAIVYSVYRKHVLVYSPDTLQDAVKWCED